MKENYFAFKNLCFFLLFTNIKIRNIWFKFSVQKITNLRVWNIKDWKSVNKVKIKCIMGKAVNDLKQI